MSQNDHYWTSKANKNGRYSTFIDNFWTFLEARNRKGGKEIQRLGYRPRAPYQLDLEVFTMTDLRQRGSKAKVRTTHRYEFHTLVCVERGACTQIVDFKPVACVPGSLLVLRPGQAHNFGQDEDWDGWILLFLPEFVQPVSPAVGGLKLAVDLPALPEHLILERDNLRAVAGAIEQIHADTQFDAPISAVHALLRHQLDALLMRICMLHGRQQAREPVIAPALQRCNRFQQLVEERFAQWHQVADYADHLGCTEKSLARAVTATLGVTAKTFLTARIALEAKRLLVHTSLSVSMITEKLGFDEPTNFSKFFKREAGCSPGEFRKRQAIHNLMRDA